MNENRLYVGAGIQPLTYPKEKYPALTQFAICERFYDECYVRAIALKTNGRLVLFFSYDLSDIPEVSDLEKKIADRVGTTEENIIISVTHNHASYCDRGAKRADPELNRRFREDFLMIEEEASLKAAEQAVSNMKAARVGYGEINSYINNNEITSQSVLGSKTDIPPGMDYSDKTLAVIKFIDDNEQVISVLMNYCCHATYGMAMERNGNNVISGNFTGIASRFVEEYYGNGCVALWTSGAAGNQHPLLRGHYNFSYTDGYEGRITLPGDSDLLLMEYAGRKHGTDAVNCINNINVYEDIKVLKRSKNSIFLKNQKCLNPQPNRKPFIDYGTGLKSNQDESPAPVPEPIIVPDPEHESELKMECLMIGDNICLIGMGAEPFCQIGRDIKQAVPAKHTVVVTHTPGYVGENPHAVGYIVDRSSADCGHSKCNRNLIPGAYDEQIVNNALHLYKDAK